MKKNAKISVAGYRGIVGSAKEFKGNSNLIHEKNMNKKKILVCGVLGFIKISESVLS